MAISDKRTTHHNMHNANFVKLNIIKSICGLKLYISCRYLKSIVVLVVCIYVDVRSLVSNP